MLLFTEDSLKQRNGVRDLSAIIAEIFGDVPQLPELPEDAGPEMLGKQLKSIARREILDEAKESFRNDVMDSMMESFRVNEVFPPTGEVEPRLCGRPKSTENLLTFATRLPKACQPSSNR